MPNRGGKRPKRYPWEEWLTRAETILVRGIHYQCSQSSMAQNIRNAACKYGVRIRLYDKGTEIWIEVVDETQEAGRELPVGCD